jgi:hypothetical protein
MTSELNYPAEILPMVYDMQATVNNVNQEMEALTSVVKILSNSSKSQIVGSFGAMHQKCSALMVNHNTTLTNVATKIRVAYEDMLAYDAHAGNQIENA